MASYLRKTDDFKLLWTIFVKECYWDTHYAAIIERNVRRQPNINCVKVIIHRIFVRRITTNQIYLLMPFIMVKISKPTNTLYSNIVSTITINTTIRSIQRIIIGDIKLSIPTCYAWPQP